MIGIQKLKTPIIEVTPKLFIITVSVNEKQHRFSKVNICLGKAIEDCYIHNYGYCKPHHYVVHVELSVNEINNLFKNYNP